MTLEVSFACREYDRVLPMQTGEVQPAGIRLLPLRFEPKQTDELFRQVLKLQYDVAEMSLNSYMKARLLGAPLIAIPVFPHRKFLQQYAFCRVDSPLTSMGELAGKRVGIPQYWVSAAVWHRSVLQHEYGIDPREIEWYSLYTERFDDARVPEGVRLTPIPAGETFGTMLRDRRLDCVLTYGDMRLPQDQKALVRPLFPNVKQVQTDYFRKTGLFPLIHTVVIGQEIADRHPWMTASLMEAFERSKLISYRHLHNELYTGLPLMGCHVQEDLEIFGQDPWPYGIKGNQVALDALFTYVTEQGWLKRRPRVEELFAANTLDT